MEIVVEIEKKDLTLWNINCWDIMKFFRRY